MQPKIKAKVKCVDGEVGEVVHVVVDPLHAGVSHIVVSTSTGERLIPIDANLVNGDDETVLLNAPSSTLTGYPGFRREEYVRLDEVEIAHAERRLDVVPGEILVPIPSLEKGTDRRSFFRNFTNILGAVLALPLLYPVLRYLLHPMYQPFDNRWLAIGSVNQLSEPDFPRLLRFSKKLKEGYIVREVQKSHWGVKA
ncbi:MAG: hypothetical protein ACREI3_02585, partial [Nitrospirales bacterium]